MKIILMQPNVKLRVERANRNEERKLHTYMVFPNGEEFWLFSGKYSGSVFRLYQKPIDINKVIKTKTKNRAVMNYVQQLNRQLHFLNEYYELPVAG